MKRNPRRIKSRSGNRIEEERRIRELGGEIHSVKGTGERYAWHPAIGRSSKYNARRKDSPRSLSRFRRRLERFSHN